MKNQIYPLLLGAAFSLATCGVSHGMSHLVSMTVEPLSPTPHQPANVFVYEITVQRAGQGLLKVDLSCEGLPEGVTASFSPSVVSFVGRAPTTKTALLTITTTTPAASGIYAFTITGQARRESITIDEQFAIALNTLVQRLPVLYVEPRSESSVNLRGEGSSNQTYEIESTPDPINPVWRSIGFSTADVSGRFNFLVENIHDLPMQFFRAVIPAPATSMGQCSGLPKP